MKTPGGKLAPDDVEPGMFVTVLGYHDVLERYVKGPDVEFWSRSDNQGGVGSAHIVLAVDLPFCVLRCVCGCGRVMTFDMRDGDLKRLTQQYVEAIKPPPQPQPADGVTRVVALPPGSSITDFLRIMMPTERPFSAPTEPPKTEPS